jgi:hypothetical protein
MPEKKPAIGVSHAVIDGKPRVMIALYLDHPSVQVTKDDEGRPLLWRPWSRVPRTIPWPRGS